MRKIKHTHSVARLRELFRYDPDTGIVGKYHIDHFKCFGQAVKHANKIRARLHAEFANNGVQPIAGAAS